MKRREFLKTSALATLPFLVNGMPVSALPRSPFLEQMASDSDKILVLIQLSGGNDGLNTIIPIDQYSNLATHRPNLLIPQNNTLPLTLETALHPTMTGIKGLYDNGQIAIVQNVGYPDQNRSHFRSMDIWQTASDADEFLTSGWLGRYLEIADPNYPTNYPNTQCPDPFAITIGGLVSETCQGSSSNFSIGISDLNTGSFSTDNQDTLPPGCIGEELDFLRITLQQANEYNARLEAAEAAGNTLSSLYDANSRLSKKLKIIAQLISGGLQTKVYVVSLGGFDTHGNQVQTGNSTTGEHADLLTELSTAITAFQDDLQLLNIADKVVGMTYSEFGRRIRENSALGTDHGTAAPLILFGTNVHAGILGNNPTINSTVDIDEGVSMQFDFRSVYTTVLRHWLCASQSEVQNTILGQAFDVLPLIANSPCCTPITAPKIVGRSEGSNPNLFVYKVPNVGGTYFNWVVGNGGTIVSGQGTNQLSVLWSGGIPNDINVYYATP